jgi:predicted GNAT superfamily acetyltransferase
MPDPVSNSAIIIRDLTTIAELEAVLRLEKEVWGFEDADVTPLTLAVAMKAAGSIWLGAFNKDALVGFAFAFPSLEQGKIGFHSHTLAVHPSFDNRGVGYQLKLAQRQRALARGITEITWTFDPLRGRNAHLNFSKLGVISDSYRPDFYGAQTSSSLHTNGTDRLWITWRLADTRVEERIKGRSRRLETLDALALLEPLVRFNGDGKPVGADLGQALSRQRIAIEIPGDIGQIETGDISRARQWRLATRRAFTEAINAGFTVTEFCRSIRGQQGPGAYLLEREANSIIESRSKLNR